MKNNMQVIKRNGKKEEVSFDKVISRIKYNCTDLTIDPILVAQKVCSRIYDNVKTRELDELTAKLCMAMNTENLDYGKLASRIIISNNHKNTSPSFSETIHILYTNTDCHGEKNPLISDDLYKLVMKNMTKLNDHIDYNRDYDFDYFAFKTLEKAYLLKVKKKVVERIQHLFMRVSLGMHGNNVKNALRSYDYMSQKYFIHATPTLYHSGTPRPQLASCYLLGTEDSVPGIYKTILDCAKISKWAGGIGVHWSNIRSKGSLIRGTNGTSNGIIPMARVYNDTANFINQSGKRPGSIAAYLEPHHPEIIEFLELRKNHGVESERARDLFLAVWLSDLFMVSVEKDEDWYLMDPDESPGLNDCYGEDYEKLYKTYVSQKKYKKKIKAREIWKSIKISQIETGTPYILFKDHINRKSNQKNVGVIKSSNLCAEIVEYSDENEYAVCTLASIGLPTYVNEKEKKFDYEKLGEVVPVIVNNLENVIDINHYPVPETKRSNMRHRPMGIGVQGLADVFAKLRIPFDSKEALEVNKNIFESIYYFAVSESNRLAMEKGPYPSFNGSPMSEGKFQFDLWGVTPSDRYDWETLRKSVMKHGVRHSLLIALMPTASSSQILGNNECFEPVTSNIYSRRTIAGDFVVVNKYLIKDMMERGLWSADMKNLILSHNGSVQNIKEIPDDIKKLYKTVWEIKQKVIIQMAIDRGPFICQTQSMNLFFEEPDENILNGAMFYGWKNGLKTGSYYIRSRPKVQAQQFTLDPEKYNSCESCSA